MLAISAVTSAETRAMTSAMNSKTHRGTSRACCPNRTCASRTTPCRSRPAHAPSRWCRSRQRTGRTCRSARSWSAPPRTLWNIYSPSDSSATERIQDMTSALYRIWLLHFTGHDACTLQGMTPAPYRAWRLHLTEHDASMPLTLTRIYCALVRIALLEKQPRLNLRQERIIT